VAERVGQLLRLVGGGVDCGNVQLLHHERPYLSFNHPHTLSSPPSVSLSQ
jgi:hypothetical protein